MLSECVCIDQYEVRCSDIVQIALVHHTGNHDNTHSGLRGTTRPGEARGDGIRREQYPETHFLPLPGLRHLDRYVAETGRSRDLRTVGLFCCDFQANGEMVNFSHDQTQIPHEILRNFRHLSLFVAICRHCSYPQTVYTWGGVLVMLLQIVSSSEDCGVIAWCDMVRILLILR